jgi:hypothetical protein
VAAFRSAIVEGQWSDAEGILIGSFHPDGGGGGGGGGNYAVGSGNVYNWEGLVLAEGADKNELLFYLRQQKFLELLDQRDLGAALMVLRQELTPLNHDIAQLHALSRCAPSSNNSLGRLRSCWEFKY